MRQVRLLRLDSIAVPTEKGSTLCAPMFAACSHISGPLPLASRLRPNLCTCKFAVAGKSLGHPGTGQLHSALKCPLTADVTGSLPLIISMLIRAADHGKVMEDAIASKL